MKKILFISLIFIMILLSGCMEEDSGPRKEYDSIYSYLEYDWYTMSYTDSPSYFITYGSGNMIDDFVILHNISIQGEELSDSAISAYSSVFVMLETLHNSSNMNYGLLLNYTSTEIKDKCDKYSIEITTTDIVSFNSLNTLIDEIKSSQYSTSLSIIDYIEFRLETTLSPDTLSSLSLLQSHYYNLTFNQQTFEIKGTVLDDFLLRISNENGVTPTAEDLVKLEEAYNIILSLYN